MSTINSNFFARQFFFFFSNTDSGPFHIDIRPSDFYMSCTIYKLLVLLLFSFIIVIINTIIIIVFITISINNLSFLLTLFF